MWLELNAENGRGVRAPLAPKFTAELHSARD